MATIVLKVMPAAYLKVTTSMNHLGGLVVWVSGYSGLHA
jgi:hypothetical protein